MDLILHPELLVVEHYLAPEFLGDWPEHVAADGFVPHLLPDEPNAIRFAEDCKQRGGAIDILIVDLDQPEPYSDVRPVYLFGVLRGLWPKLPAVFFSTDAERRHLIQPLPPPREFILREEDRLYDFLEALRPHLLRG
jgi:hypothetical protein